jgi:hypothetical protein
MKALWVSVMALVTRMVLPEAVVRRIAGPGVSGGVRACQRQRQRKDGEENLFQVHIVTWL